MKSIFSILSLGALCVLLAAGCSEDSTTTKPEVTPNIYSDVDCVIDRFSCSDCQAEGILFTRYLDELLETGGRTEVHMLSDSLVVRVTHNEVRNDTPVWVPFENVFINVTRDYYHYYLELVCTDGGMSTELFPGLPNTSDYIGPSLTWDGRQICFIRCGRPSGSYRWVVVYDVEAGSFTEYELGDYGLPMTAKISPNGKYIACTMTGSRVCLIDTSTGEARLLTDIDSGSPAFSPDSRQIVYSEEHRDNRYATNLWLMDIRTGNRRQLTDDTTVKDFDACFSPMGDQIVFARRYLPDYGRQIYHLWILNLDDMTLAQKTDGDENDRDPHWR